MATDTRNRYRTSAEVNQAGKYEVRLEARYARRGVLRVFFLASTPARVLSHLQNVLRFLQQREEELWLWGSSGGERNLRFEQLLREANLQADHRAELPRGAVEVSARSGKSVRTLPPAVKRRLTAQLASPAKRDGARATEAVGASA